MTTALSHRLTVTTRTRQDFITLFIDMARAFHPGFFHNPAAVPYIAVNGGFNTGKSLAIEAMMKTLDDHSDERELLTAAPCNKMYLEREPSEAVEGVSTLASVYSQKAKLAFNSEQINESRKHLSRQLKNQFAAQANIGGAFFFSMF